MSKKLLATVNDYKTTFSSETGTRVLWDLMKQNYVIRSTAQNSDPVSIAFHEGRRNAVLDILQKMKVDENRLIQLIEEGKENDGRDIDGF